MNINLNKQERSELFKELVNDESKSMVRKLFAEKYQEILEKEITYKLDSLVNQAPDLFRTAIRDKIHRLADQNISENFGKKADRGYYATLSGMTYSDEIKDKLVSKIYDHVKNRFDIKSLTKEVKQKVINKLVNEELEL